ncbi:DUF2167 domain-containing protein [Hymenobacter sp. BT186]|uniref:DUF2167 domain-containing protein n=1 Tax=Hymenobacter telluris TaxID=2816474 RepID=A0A939F0M6_9BACT|nr:DUF2167 domain-containing protein [Hymenobacter telluris]MBO0360571.1 DUF2167 domain-containing protein [Hymenobacter telluris]MBW3376598.1 DUF2167 domain-containing protein [Hymenobacter norwichensis]
MKKLLFLLALVSSHFVGFAAPTAPDSVDREQAYIDSVHTLLHYETGHIVFPDSLGSIDVPKGFRYLNARQSNYVLTTLWGNPSSESLGMLLPADRGPLDDNNWAFLIEYDPSGYVSDKDVAEIDYDDLLKEMQDDTEAGNAERVAAGYGRILLLGWAAKPFYDAKLNVLHWAKELRFSGTPATTLNYNVRVLGRRGVLNLQAIGDMSQLPEIRNSIPAVIKSVAFAKGQQYADFNASIDEVAAYGIGGLVAGKVLAKAGALALFAKFWKIILAVVASSWAAIRRFFGGKDR